MVTIQYHGSTLNGGTADAKSGAAIWYGDGDPRNRAGKIPASFNQSTTNAELAAALLATQTTHVDTPMNLVGSRKTIQNTMRNLESYEDVGWTGVKDKILIKSLGSALRARGTTRTLITADDGKLDRRPIEQAKEASWSPDVPVLAAKTDGPADLILSGAKLSSLTQALAYKGIKALRKKVNRKTTDENIALVQAAVKQHHRHAPTPSTIWKSLKHKDITRQVRTFLWKTVHGAHRIGKFWEHITGFEERAVCKHCEATESFTHLALECAGPGQSQVWCMAQDFWTQKHEKWPTLSLGSILGCGLAVFEDEKGKPLTSTARLYRILITESLYLIWKLRCEFVIQRNGELPPTESEIRNRWVHQINERIKIDRGLTDKFRFGRQYYVQPRIVMDTWRGTLENEKDLPRDWPTEAEVLVGIAPVGSFRPPSPARGIG
ncbi:hypothetical protein C8R43DRAFT_907040 [Mycena crocata]|nr:hypothetical protein C8R43DRAFT_907040 [Mycena crocata]